MPAEAFAGLQGLAAVVHLALWVSKAENAPKEVHRCLELVQLIYRDTQYLIELRNENVEALEQTPRELERINDIIITATRSIQDIGTLLEKYRPEAHGGRTSLKSRIIWVVADSETFNLRAPNLMTQHSTILTEIQLLRNFQMMAPMFKVAGKAEQAEQERNFENVNLLRSLMGGNSRSLTDDIVTRKLTSGKFLCQTLGDLELIKKVVPLGGSSEASLSTSGLSARPRTPTYDILGHVRPQAEVQAHSGLPHQPSLLSLFAPTPPPPYCQSETVMKERMVSSPSEPYPGFSSPEHVQEPYILSATISDPRPTSHAYSEQQSQRSQASPSESVGLKALFLNKPSIGQFASVQSSVYSQHKQSWDVPLTHNSAYTHPRALTTADRIGLPAQLSPTSQDRLLTPVEQSRPYGPFLNGLLPEALLAQKEPENWPQPTALAVPSLSTKASNMSMLQPATVQEAVYELDTEPCKRETLFELEGSIPTSSRPFRRRSPSLLFKEQEDNRSTLVGP